MSVQCMSTGYMATLNFKPGAEALVEGHVEQQQKQQGARLFPLSEISMVYPRCRCVRRGVCSNITL